MVESFDQRDFRRMAVDCPVRYWRLGTDVQQWGRVRNLSSAGLLFVAGEGLEPGERLCVHLAPEKDVTPPLEAVVEVLRVESDAEGGFEIACSIIEIG